MTTLAYRAGKLPDELAVGECVMRPTRAGSVVYWRLDFCVTRTDNGQPQIAGVPVNIGGDYTQSGPAGKTWGLKKIAEGTWQVSPSINVLAGGAPHPGEHPTEPSIWHHTPQIVGVPAGERWQSGAAP